MKRFSPQANILLNCSESFHTTLKKKSSWTLLIYNWVEFTLIVASLIKHCYVLHTPRHTVCRKERGVFCIYQKNVIQYKLCTLRGQWPGVSVWACTSKPLQDQKKKPLDGLIVSGLANHSWHKHGSSVWVLDTAVSFHPLQLVTLVKVIDIHTLILRACVLASKQLTVRWVLMCSCVLLSLQSRIEFTGYRLSDVHRDKHTRTRMHTRLHTHPHAHTLAPPCAY